MTDDLDQAHFQGLAACTQPEDKKVVPFEPRRSAESDSDQGNCLERTTGFEPATLTLARYADLFR